MPASWPRRRGKFCLIAQRPLPSMITPTCSLSEGVVCITKFLGKKISGRKHPKSIFRGFFSRRLRGIPHQPLQHREILQEPAPARFGQATTRVRAVALITFGDLDKPGFLQHLKVTAEITVGETAQLPEITERQSLGVGHERREQAKP